MKFIHLSDSHLGKYDRNLIERFRDNGNAVKQIFEYAVNEKVDFVVHSGDLFDSHRPNPDTIKQAIVLLNILKKANIPFIVTEGNHDMKKGIQYYSIFNVLEEMELLHFVTVESSDKGDRLIKYLLNGKGINIYGLGYIRGGSNSERLRKLASQITGDNNIILIHIGITGSYYKSKTVDSVGGQELSDIFANKYIYMGLGHYHDTAEQPTVNIYQAGATERWTIGEGKEKNFMFATYENKVLKVIKKSISIRPWIEYDENFNDWDEAMRNLKNWVIKYKDVKDNNTDRIKYSDKPIYYVRLRGQVKRNYISDEFFEITHPLDGLIAIKKNEILVSSYMKNIKDWESMDEKTISREILKEYYSNSYGDNAEKLVDLTMKVMEASEDYELSEKDIQNEKSIKEKIEPLIQIYQEFGKEYPECLDTSDNSVDIKKNEEKEVHPEKQKTKSKKSTKNSQSLDNFVSEQKKKQKTDKKSIETIKSEENFND